MPPFAHTKPCARLGDQHAALHAHDPARLAQDDLDLAGVAVPGRRPSRSPAGDGSTVRRSTTAPSALDTTFWVTTRTSPGCGGERAGRRLERVADHRLEVVALVDLGQAGERDDLDPGRRRQSTCERLGRDRLGEQQVLGRVDVEAEHVADLANAASADDASQAWPARESPPNAGSMTSGGSSSRAFVPRPWRSGARTTDGRPAASPAARTRSSAAASTAGMSAGG